MSVTALNPFRTTFAENIFRQKYAQGDDDSWHALAVRLVDDVCGRFQGKGEPLLSVTDRETLVEYISEMKFIPGGRYLYYAGRPFHGWNNCFLLKGEEDTREEWGALLNRASSCLMTGGGIGVDYSVFRPRGAKLGRTGGVASGPLPLMRSINEVGRNVQQGGARRSAIYASLNWRHQDAEEFLHAKDWHTMGVGKSGYTLWDAKQDDFNFHAPLDMTNISLNYDDAFLEAGLCETFLRNVDQACRSGEPGLSFNFGPQEMDTLRNACCEVVSADDSDVCNLGSINLANVESPQELESIVELATKFLVCGTLRATLPYEKVDTVRVKNRRLGLGLMGIHEWLLKRGYPYEVVPELHNWLGIYRVGSNYHAQLFCDALGISRPVACRAIAPTGTIGIMASTTTGIEPLYAVAYKRRYLTAGTVWKYEYVVDATAQCLIEEYGLDPDRIETAAALAPTPERRIKFQADVQDYVDMAISSTINLPAWGTPHNNPDTVQDMARLLRQYAPRLRGFTCYPDGARGGQPLTLVEYATALRERGVVFEEHVACKDGVCGI